jgi:ATP/maltotriose-dependent transcriptional regulator MalT
MNRGRVAESLRWVHQMQEAAQTSDDPDLMIVGHLAAVHAYLRLGDPVKAGEHVNRVLALYSQERHGHLVGMLNADPKTIFLVFSAQSAWILGHPERAAQLWDDCETYARKLGHPFDLGWALTTGAQVFDFLGEPEELLKRLQEAERLGREKSMSYFLEIAATAFRSGAYPDWPTRRRDGSARDGIAAWEGAGGGLTGPYFKTVLAEGMAHVGDSGGALQLIDEVITQVERPGWEERWYYAETLGIRGWLLGLTGDLEGAERAYMVALEWARQQQAKSWELRTATSYARLLRDQGRAREARDLLVPIYEWFTEGFGTKDLTAAKAMLEELETSGALEPVAPA